MDANTTVETIDITPQFDESLYSPHVRALKHFVEELTQHALAVAEQRAEDAEGDNLGPIETSIELASFIETEIDALRLAVGNVLADDIFLLADGKRMPGQAVGD